MSTVQKKPVETRVGEAIGVALHQGVIVWAALSTSGALSIALWSMAGLQALIILVKATR